ncbi:MAG: RNA polymerase factor sigma-54, partial [Psychrobacter sp.]
MSMSFGLATTLSTSQKLTPQMQQAIKLLQLSSLELAQEVQAKLDSNPLLERVEDDEDEYDHSGDDTIDELNEPLTLDSWNQNSDADSSTANSEYDEGFSDSFDKLQQVNIDDGAVDNHTMDSDDYSSFDSATDYNSADSGNHASVATNTGNKSDEDFDSYQGG